MENETERRAEERPVWRFLSARPAVEPHLTFETPPQVVRFTLRKRIQIFQKILTRGKA
jgi:hypothetical protein